MDDLSFIVSWLLDFSEYIVGSLIFFLTFYTGVKIFNRILLNLAVDAISEIIDKINKESLPQGKKDDKIDLKRNKEKEIEKEIEGLYESQPELDAIDRQFEQNKSGKKIIGFNFKDAIKGRWTKMLAAKKIQILQQIDPKIISENGIHQAMLQAQRGGKIGKGM